MFKYFAIYIIRFLLHIFYILPVNKKKIFFTSYEGRQFTCNPKYIFLDIYKKMPELKYVWCLNNGPSEISDYDDIVVVKSDTLIWLYHILTSKVIITNFHLRGFLPYRKNQVILNTWHGGGAYKTVGVSNHSDKANKFWNKKVFQSIFPSANKNIKYFISSCKVFSDVMPESYCVPNKCFLPIGMPRNDIFFKNNNEYILLLKGRLNIPPDAGIVLYAPTHRSNLVDPFGVMNKAINNLDIEKLRYSLKEKYKKEFVCLFRGHYVYLQKNLSQKTMIDVSSYNDMQELLLIADVLITDYSSCTWDFSLTSKSCFLFCPDFDFYLAHDRGFYIPIEQWPYPLAKTNDELCNNIAIFNQEEYNDKVKKHHEDLGSYEQGTATSQVTQLLQEIFA